ncbi:SgcJ/EcaC family oxidoreductase [Paenibacillus aurantius]|uniref:SgcJ/EcaC family oxidoreductase n=1 Tax=Paenibacillus aurantius TaxID=2918900 RepID=A0AA96RDI4_9BACL|nr:SgcJ/EcaC family oxidoreductase [Paenibacillus aurantius]WNQ11425.1 SgcJ/EcaC family oxidoreductase [Paenibacillus aurantius]
MSIVQDREAVQEVFKRLSEAWNRGDGAAYGSCFTEDADYITFSGQHLKGSKQIGEVHQWLFDGPLRGSVLEYRSSDSLEPRFLGPDTAIVIAVGEARLAGAAEAAEPDRGSINTNVLVKREGQWKLTAFHNCRIQETPGGRR